MGGFLHILYVYVSLQCAYCRRDGLCDICHQATLEAVELADLIMVANRLIVL
jgi:hypothetical protein